MKKRRFKFLYLCVAIMLGSCSVERVNLSPTTSIISQSSSITTEKLTDGIESQSKFILYSSEITNSFNGVENLSYQPINTEISNLKFYITEFLYATQAYNTMGKEKALYNYEKSYKKVQKMKEKLTNDEQEILNRFLVKVKTNISLIESLKDNS